MPEPLKLFISYRSSDAPKVDKIARDLALLKHEDGTPRYAPWQDKHNLPPASPHWWDAIVEAIEASKVRLPHLAGEPQECGVPGRTGLCSPPQPPHYSSRAGR